MNISEVVGWAGTTLIVLAYFLVSSKKVSSTGAPYQLMNLFGALGVGANVFHQRAWPSVALQSVWFIIALVSLVNIKKSPHDISPSAEKGITS